MQEVKQYVYFLTTAEGETWHRFAFKQYFLVGKHSQVRQFYDKDLKKKMTDDVEIDDDDRIITNRLLGMIPHPTAPADDSVLFMIKNSAGEVIKYGNTEDIIPAAHISNQAKANYNFNIIDHTEALAKGFTNLTPSPSP